MSQNRQLEAHLHQLALNGQTISYGALARALALRIGALTAALEDLMEEDARNGQPFRAAVCEGKLNQGLPAQGFFDKAAALGRPLSPQDIAQERAALRKAAQS